ncbi:MAG: hypothetical protein HUU01_18275 [Saprospiraceae bacterium]|nr:hypothetical protein [Saprospiraceae bacterium]
MKKILWKLVKGMGITLAGILLLMVALPVLFPGAVAEQIKAWTNETIEGDLQFSKARLSFFRHFPALTLTLHDFPSPALSLLKKTRYSPVRPLVLGSIWLRYLATNWKSIPFLLMTA